MCPIFNKLLVYGIDKGSSFFSLIAEIILGYTDILLAQEIANKQEKDNLPKRPEYEIFRYVDDERFNFRMNSSKTRTSLKYTFSKPLKLNKNDSEPRNKIR